MKFELPILYGNPSKDRILVESVYSDDTSLMGYRGKFYYCLVNNDPDIYDTLKLRILEAKWPLDRIKYAEAVIIETEGKWVVIKSRYGATTNSNGEVTVFPVGYVQPKVVKTTKAHIVEVLVIDHEHMGVDEIKLLLSQNRYISPSILSSKTADIGKWTDEHPLNYTNCTKETILEYFNDETNIKKN